MHHEPSFLLRRRHIGKTLVALGASSLGFGTSATPKDAALPMTIDAG